MTLRSGPVLLLSLLNVPYGEAAFLDLSGCRLEHEEGSGMVTSTNCDLGVKDEDGKVHSIKSLAADMKHVFERLGIHPPSQPPPPPVAPPPFSPPPPPFSPPLLHLVPVGQLEYSPDCTPDRWSVVEGEAAADAVTAISADWSVFARGNFTCADANHEFTFVGPGDNTCGNTGVWKVKCMEKPAFPCIIAESPIANGWIGRAGGFISVPCAPGWIPLTDAQAYKLPYTASTNCPHPRGVEKLSDGVRSEDDSYRSGTACDCGHKSCGNDDVAGVHIDLDLGSTCTVHSILLGNGFDTDTSGTHQPDEVRVTYGDTGAADFDGGVHSLRVQTSNSGPMPYSLLMLQEASGRQFRIQITSAGATTTRATVHGWVVEEIEVYGICA